MATELSIAMRVRRGRTRVGALWVGYQLRAARGSVDPWLPLVRVPVRHRRHPRGPR